MKIRTYTLTFLFLMTGFFKTFGTAQMPDILIYNGDTLALFSNPLEQLENIDSLREHLFGYKESYWTTACYRKYQAEWTLMENQLYLTAIYSCNYDQDRVEANLETLFGKSFLNGRVLADWVTAELLSPQGKELLHVHSYYESLYEKEVVFKIVSGQLQGASTYDNSKSRISNYSQDEALQKFIYSNVQWDILPRLDKTAKVFVQFSGNEQGAIDSVKVMKGFVEPYDSEALRVVKSIPEWDVLYRHGQFERRTLNLQIVFSEENKRKYLER